MSDSHDIRRTVVHALECIEHATNLFQEALDKLLQRHRDVDNAITLLGHEVAAVKDRVTRLEAAQVIQRGSVEHE